MLAELCAGQARTSAGRSQSSSDLSRAVGLTRITRDERGVLAQSGQPGQSPTAGMRRLRGKVLTNHVVNT